jgi:hypothetical protein
VIAISRPASSGTTCAKASPPGPLKNTVWSCTEATAKGAETRSMMALAGATSVAPSAGRAPVTVAGLADGTGGLVTTVTVRPSGS